MKAALALLAAAPFLLAQAADSPVPDRERQTADAQRHTNDTRKAASDLPRGYPCNSSVPVFNPQACAPRKLTVVRTGGAAGERDKEAATPPADGDETDAVACRDKIEQVRAENGQPALRRETADPDVPLLIAAVDHRIDGCGVLVMRQDTSDVRPVPEVPEGPVKLIPAR